MAQKYFNWKHTLSTTPKEKDIEYSLVSLYDLFYDSDGKLWVDYTDDTAGTTLDHDIICLNRNILTSSNEIDTSQTTEISTSLWWTYGIDMSIARFDARAKFRDFPCDASIGESNEIFVFNNKTFRVYDKDSALAPQNIETFTANGVCSTGVIQSANWDNYRAPSIGVFNVNAGGNYAEDIILSNEDTVFKSTLVTQDAFVAYNKIFVNPYSLFGVGLVAKATGMNINQLMGINLYAGFNGTQIPTTFNTLKNFWERGSVRGNFIARAVNLGANAAAKGTPNESTYDESRWFFLLKNTFVWVRSTFFGDYVKPGSFEQDLTPEAKVVHSELMLSGAGDFKLYDTYYSSDAETVADIGEKNQTQAALSTKESSGILKDLNPSENSMPYIPKTSPTIDIYTSKFIDNNSLLNVLRYAPKDGNYSSKLSVSSGNTSKIEEFLENFASGNNMQVKGLPIASINRDLAKASDTGNTTELTPPNWFNPESRYNGQYYADMGKMPSVLPMDGNLYVDGRIIGPTVDEIWIMLKKLTGGRLSDDVKTSSTTESANLTRAQKLDIGIPYGNNAFRHNDKDTTLTEVPDSEFNFRYDESTENNRYGDPVDFVYEPDGSSTDGDSGIYNQKIKITKFINQNDSIVYPLYKSLKDLSAEVTTFDTSENNERGISNFTAWKDIDTRKENLADNATVSDGDYWTPRETPYSLRELEAMIMGNKYNIISQARFLKENFAVTGGLGKITGNEDPNDMSNFASGSLYQFHRHYNFDVKNPNTYFNAKGTPTGYDENGKIVGAAVFNTDEDWRNDIAKSEGHIRYVDNYGTSNDVSVNPNTISSIDVYMSAYGDWRSSSFYSRIPCLRDEF